MRVTGMVVEGARAGPSLLAEELLDDALPRNLLPPVPHSPVGLRA